MRLPALLLAAWAAFAAPAAFAAIDEADLLPVETAFALQVTAPTRDAIELTWKIAPGYYLYRHRLAAKPQDDSVDPGTLELPGGERKHDEFFGDVETYRGTLKARLPIRAPATMQSVELEIRSQGCADVGVCYPPQRQTMRVALPVAIDAVQESSLITGAPTQFTFGGQQDAVMEEGPLPEEQAFRVEALIEPGSTATDLRAAVRFTMPRGYYLYRDKTGFAVAKGIDGVTLGSPGFPPGQSYRDEHFGDVIVYFTEAEILLPILSAPAGLTQLPIEVSFQGCQDGGICYPPMRRTVVLPVAAALAGNTTAASGSSAPTDSGAVATTAARNADDAEAAPAARAPASGSVAGALADDSRIAESLRGAGRGWALLTFFGLGLLLAFTPCVLPMIPILSGIIAGAGPNLSTARALALSVVYVLASAVVFMIAGVIAGLAGASLQSAFQNPWVLVAFALLFVALALSMFGLFELQLPASLQSRLAGLSNRQRAGSLGGVAVMGALSALIVGPCVAPPLAGAVLYISQTRDAVFGGAALFTLALGMGAPLVVFGVTAGRLMPRAGAWMDAVKAGFGVVFLLLAVWMLERIVPPPVTLLLAGIVLIGAGVAMRALDPLPDASGGRRRVAKAAGVLVLLLGIAQVAGALAGGDNWMRPLAPFAGGGGGESSQAVEFRPVKTVEDLDRELVAAGAAGKPLLLDFYADWCVACKEMERDTFSRPEVVAAAERFVRLKADVTANDDADRALLKRFGLIGPPATLLFAADGREQRALRLLGFEKAEDFRARLERSAGSGP